MRINSTKVDSEKLAKLEDILYGKDAVAADAQNNISAQEAIVASLPTPDRIIAILNGTDNE